MRERTETDAETTAGPARGSDPEHTGPGGRAPDHADRDHADRDHPDRGHPEPGTPTDLPRESWVAAVKRAGREFGRDQLTDRAAALTYYGLLALAPVLVVLVAALGLAGPDIAQRAVEQTRSFAPGSSGQLVAQLVAQAQANRSGASLGALLGIVVSLWSASGYVAAFMRASNVVYDVPEGRPFWKTVPIRVGITLLSVLVLAASAVIVVVSGPVAHQVGDLLGLGDTAVLVWNVLKWPVLLVLLSLLLAVLYWASPNAKQPGIRWVTPGSIVAVVLWLVVSGLFALYVAYFASYNRTYGSLAGVVVFLVWLWLTNISLLLGAELNAELDRGRAIATGFPEDVEPYAEPRDTRKLDERERDAVEHAATLRPEQDGRPQPD